MEKGILKKASAVALASVMAVSLVPVMGTMTNGTVGQIVADAAQADRSGTCGEYMTWKLDEEGTLTISGSGRMYDFADEEAPWYEIRSEIKSLQVGNNVTRLGMYAFWDCSNLSEVKLPDSLKEIGRGAFEDCDSLKSITFPANLESIFADAFYDCDGLEMIHIPASVTLVDDAAFDECSSVRKITVASGNKVYDSRDNCNAIIETSENTLIRGCMNTIIPEGVSCNSLAFTGFSVERVLRNSGLSEVVETDVETSSEDTTLLGVAGTYVIDNALKRINEIRLEACKNGEPNPNDPTRALTEADYVPIKWSSDLEYIARIRAAESAFTIAHKRTNGSDWSEISGPTGQVSEEELMALTMASEELQGIEVWYAEKEDWINQNPGADTGHYKQMIDPTNLYVGIGTFASARTYYEKNVVGEFSKESGLDETPGKVSGDRIQKLEVSNDVISNPVICGFLEGATGDTENLSVAVDVEYDVEYSAEDDPDYRWTVEGLIVLDDITWTSSDESVATIDENGKVLAKFPGETTITADFGLGTTATANYVVAAKPGWQKIDGDWYYFEQNGTMAVSKWMKDSKGWCWLQADGKMLTNGWAKDSKGYCWIGGSGYMVVKTQWIQDEGIWYHITNGYRDQNKWVQKDGKWCYVGSDGTMVTSTWKKDSKGWCYLDADGFMVTNDWAPDSKGWCWIASNGYMPVATQWIKYNGGWYHITKGYRDENKWMKDSKGWCWLQEDGRMLTNGWAQDSKGWCWIASNGYMPTTTQWVKYDGGWYHITKGYRDQNKWMKDSKGWCWLQEDGRMLTNGWANDSKGECWIAENGYMPVETGWVTYDGYDYYIEKGYKAVNKTITIDGIDYVFDADGHWEKAVVEESK